MSELLQLRPIQPVDLPGFQYSIARPQAGRNKYQDLADVLSQINPALAQFSRISAAKQQLIQQEEEKRRKEDEAQVQAGREAVYFGGDPISDGLKKVSRKAVESGQLLDKDNAAFQIGALQAQGVTAVKGPYRDMLYSQVNTLEGDIGEFIEQTRLEFIKQPEFANPSVRSFAFEEFNKVEDEFRNDVEKIRDAANTETFKRAWLELGRPVVNGIISGELDVNDPNMIGWLNHSAGVFKGSQEYAWTNLIKEQLREGLSKEPGEVGSISPNQVDGFLDKLRTLDLGGGVKFADAEVGNAITSFYDSTENIRIKWENNKNKQLNENYETKKGLAVDLLLKSMGDGPTVTASEASEIRDVFLASVPPTQKQKGLSDFNDILKNINKPTDDMSSLVVGNIETNIAEGEDLTKTVTEVNNLFRGGSITATQRLNLLDKIDKERDFDQLVYKTEGVRKLSEGYENVITGFNTTRIGKATYEEGYFTQLGVPSDMEANDKKDVTNGSVYNQILLKTGSEYASKRFVNSRYYAFNKDFKQANLLKFKEYEADPQTSPQEAANKVLEEMQETARSVFKDWEKESIEEAKRLYKIEIFTTGEELQQAFPEDL